jgi:hypothetical protein
MIVGATIFAVLITTFNFVGKYADEQTRAANLTTASKAWSLDANNSSQVFLRGDKTAIFYELPGRSPGVYQQRGSGSFRDDCRKSVWTLDGGVLSNTVSYFNNEVCDLGTSPGTPAATTKTISVDGFATDAVFVASNSAGRDLHYNASGLEVGLSTTVPAAQKSTATRDSYWRDYEWEWSQPSLVKISRANGSETQVAMPLTGPRPTDIAGKTWITPTAEGDTLTNPEEQPEQTLYNPGPINNLRVERSATNGDIYGSMREGIQITWDYVTCGPFTTEYTVRWVTSTTGAENHEVTFTSYGAFEPVQIEGVPNGSVGQVAVVAACPPSVSNATSTDTVNYTQTLPAPVLAGSENSARPHEHNLSWGPVSSLQAVRYRVEQSINNGAWTPSPAISPNPKDGVTAQLTFDTGSTYGQNHRYRAIAVLPPVESNPSNIVTIQTPWPPIAAPTITGTNPTTASYQTTVSAITCPAGTSGQYQQRYRFGTSAWSAWTTWGTTRVMTTNVAEGARIQVNAQVRCAYNATQFSPTQAARNTAQWIRPIVTVPATPTVTFTDPSADADPVPANFVTTGCPAGTTPEYSYRYRLNEATSYTSFTSWSGDTSALIAILRGGRIEIEVKARCVSPYAQGPESPTNTETWIRPIPAPPGLTNLTTNDQGTAEPINNRIIHDAAVCPAGTTAEYRYRQTTPAPTGAWTTWAASPVGGPFYNVDTAWGRYYVWEAVARCISPYLASDPSPTRSTTWTTNLPLPSGNITLAAPSTTPMDIEYNVTIGGNSSCPAGTTIRYAMTGTNNALQNAGRAWFNSGWSTFETDKRSEPTRWNNLSVSHTAPKARANFYDASYVGYAVCDGPDRDASITNPLEALSTVPGPGQGLIRVNYPVVNNTATAERIRVDQGGSGNSTTLDNVFTYENCSGAGQWGESRFRYRINTTGAGNAWSGWSTWGDTAGRERYINNTRQNTTLPVLAGTSPRNLGDNRHLAVLYNVAQGHRLDVDVQHRCIDPYTQDSLNNKGPASAVEHRETVRNVENPTGMYLEQPFWSGVPNGTQRSVGIEANCSASTVGIQYQWRNDGAGGNTGVWQGWFNPNSGNGFRTGNITATWANWYGSSANYICVGVFANSGVEFRQTGGVQAEIPPAPGGVYLNVSGSNVDTWRGTVYTGTTVSTSGSWSASAGGGCPAGTNTQVDWASPTSQSASASRSSSSAGTYYSGWVTRSFGASVYCAANDNGTRGAGVGTGWQDRSVRVGANWEVPPYPGTPTGGSYDGSYMAALGGTDYGGYVVNTLRFNGSGGANANGYNNSVRIQGTVPRNGGTWTGWATQIGCFDGASSKQAQSQATNGWGSSGWFTTGATSVPTGIDRVNMGCF